MYRDDITTVVRGRATGYARRGASEWAIDDVWMSVVCGGGIEMSMNDAARWDGMFLDDTFGIVRTCLTRGVLTDGTELTYAFGLEHGTYRGVPTVSHGGSMAGFRAEILRCPTLRAAVAIFANASDVAPSTLALRVADIAFGDELGPAKDRAEPPAPDTWPADADGNYMHDEEAIVVRLAGDALEVRSETLVGERDGSKLRLPSGLEAWFSSGRLSLCLPGGEPIWFDRLPAVEVDPAPFVGNFESPELGTVLAVDGELDLTRDGKSVGRLEPVGPDRFAAAGHVYRFEDGCLFVDAGRALGVRFERAAPR